MEHAPLRPVPSRPPSPVDPAEAIRHVTAELSALDAPAAEALALIALAGRSRDEVAGQAGMSPEQLAEALARARKALRRKVHPLPGSGWCERAERLISDRIDDALEEPGPARLKLHLANCSRCVEHERRLAQAQDALVDGFVESTAPPLEAGQEPEARPQPEADVEAETPDEPPSAPPAPLRIVAEEAPALPEPEEPAALPEAVDAPARREQPALEEPDESPALGEVATMPAAPPAPGAAPTSASRPPLDRGQPPPPAPPHAPPRVTAAPRPPASPATPARSRLAATYAPVPTLDGSRRFVDDETWGAVGPLLVLFTLAIAMLAFAVLTVGL